jgi:transposase InsO family protein
VIPFYEERGIPLQRVLTDRGTEYCGTHDRHEYEFYLAVEDIDHTRTKTRSLQTNGIIERFHKTMLDEFYRIAFRKKIYATIDDFQVDLDLWMRAQRGQAPSGKWCFGKTPLQSDAGTETNNSARRRMAIAAQAAIGSNTYILV